MRQHHFWSAAGGKISDFRSFSVQILTHWAYMTFLKILKFLLKHWAYMTSYMVSGHCNALSTAKTPFPDLGTVLLMSL